MSQVHTKDVYLSQTARVIANTLVTAWDNGAITPNFEADEGPYNTVRAPAVSLLDRASFNELVRAGYIHTEDKGAGRLDVTLLPRLSEYVKEAKAKQDAARKSPTFERHYRI